MPLYSFYRIIKIGLIDLAANQLETLHIASYCYTTAAKVRVEYFPITLGVLMQEPTIKFNRFARWVECVILISLWSALIHLCD